MRPPIRPAGLALLLLAGAFLAAAPAGARVVQTGKPPPAAVESGGQQVPAGSAPRAGCAAPMMVEMVCALAAPFAPFAFGAWFGVPQAEVLARLGAATRLQAATEREAWRAPRLAAKAAVRRAVIERKRGSLSHRN